MIDQTVWQDASRSLSLFLRGGFSPPDRNLVSYYVDGGFGLKGPIAGRKDDVLLFGVAHSGISGDAVALDRDTLAFAGAPYPIRNAETVIELTYVARIAPWWTLQPDFQYIVHPRGHAANPRNQTRPIPDAFLVGLRTSIAF